MTSNKSKKDRIKDEAIIYQCRWCGAVNIDSKDWVLNDGEAECLCCPAILKIR